MKEICFLNEDEKYKLESIFEQDIINLKNNLINKKEFILIIKSKNISLYELIYLVNKYVSSIEIVDENLEKIKEGLLNSDEIFCESNIDCYYDKNIISYIPKFKMLKKIKKYENMKRGRNIYERKRAACYKKTY